ncbi:hypothetical protein [Streptomyces sp. B8F3]|uniref:hypothetical protein n=1 Tax=unclassified Streptomyces TaxID=2593676 RepID=UPI00325D4C98
MCTVLKSGLRLCTMLRPAVRFLQGHVPVLGGTFDAARTLIGILPTGHITAFITNEGDTYMRMKTRVAGAAMAGAVLLPVGASTAFGESASTGSAAEATRTCSADLPDDPTAATNHFLTRIHTLESQGLTQARIDAKLAEDDCLERVDQGGEVGTRANPDDEITISKPVFYKVSGTNKYFSRAAWKWMKVPDKVKGYDGFSLRFSKKVAPVSHVLRYRGKNLGWKSTSQAETSHTRGSGFIFNEGPRITGPVIADMQGLTGELGITFRKASTGCTTIQGFSKYGHTWNSTNVTGITIGATSIGYTWSSTSSRWQQASQPSSEVRICR